MIAERVKRVFQDALELPPAEREGFIREHCGSDLVLLDEVQSLLRHHEGPTHFLAAPTAESSATVGRRAVGFQPGDSVGRYAIQKCLGEGGMGAVYLAEQTDPIRRLVALKVVKAGMDTQAVVARFEAERQTLATLDHPNVARVFDAGATPAGQPYFVMEYVDGAPITRACDAANLSTEARLQVFLDVCDAVQHAHQRGVIHRDIKPANVLVSRLNERLLPKVIDFGIAKATGLGFGDQQELTEHNQIIGTPEYMSPEQSGIGGQPVDTRSDIYSLGVLLYELLVGVLPYDTRALRAAGLSEFLRVLREVPAPRPSTRLSGLSAVDSAALAGQRAEKPETLLRRLRGDLDWIALRALEKEPQRRYPSVSDFAADIRRHLRSEPVAARPPSAWYVLSRFARRHREAALGIAAAAVALVIGAIGLTIGMVRAAQEAELAGVAAQRAADEARRATAEAARSRTVVSFLEDMLAGVGPGVALGRDTALLEEILQKTTLRLATDLRDEPGVEADLRRTLGATYLALGKYADAEGMLRVAHDLQARSRGAADAATLDAAASLSLAIVRQARIPEARQTLVDAIEAWRGAQPDRAFPSPAAPHTLGLIHREAGQPQQAEPWLAQALEIAQRDLGPRHEKTLLIRHDWGVLLRWLNRSEEAVTFLRETADIQAEVLGPEHPDTLDTLNSLGVAWYVLKRIDEALPLLEQVLAARRRVLGDGHAQTLLSFNNLAGILRINHQPERAAEVLRPALAAAIEKLGPDHALPLLIRFNLGMTLRALGDSEEAEACLTQAYDGRLRVFGPKHLDVIKTAHALAEVRRDLGHTASALELFRVALDGFRSLAGPSDANTIQSLRAYCDLLTKLGREADAQQTLAGHAAAIRAQVETETDPARRAALEQAVAELTRPPETSGTP